MHYYIIIGAILIAIGTGLTIYGGYLASKKDGEQSAKVIQEKIAEVLLKIDATKDTFSDPNSKKSLENIEVDLKEWATQFLKNKESKKLSFEKNRLSVSQVQLDQSNVARPIYEYILYTTKQIIEAYNHETSGSIKVEVNTLPENLYTHKLPHFFGKVVFTDNIIWKFFIYARTSPTLDTYPALDISIDSRNDNQIPISSVFSDIGISIGKDDKGMKIILKENNFPFGKGLSHEYQENEYQEKLKIYLQQLIENQLLHIESSK